MDRYEVREGDGVPGGQKVEVVDVQGRSKLGESST